MRRVDQSAHEAIIVADEQEAHTGEERDGIEQGIALELDPSGHFGTPLVSTLKEKER